ncbi:hypothetical protein GCM10009786_19210 [Leucobacter alluvii]|uniref:Uncharacterized protein n=1 Tax=Leucobacter alluvii TaxID=340321 RepID=A0ABN3B661_9MICO|nr:hypothetical protein [Leucobacter sp. L43]
MIEPHRARPTQPSAGPVAAATAVSLSSTARSQPVIPVHADAEPPQQHPLRLASLAALFGLSRRRSVPANSALPDDDPYIAYLRWASKSAAATADRSIPRDRLGRSSALDDSETAAA